MLLLSWFVRAPVRVRMLQSHEGGTKCPKRTIFHERPQIDAHRFVLDNVERIIYSWIAFYTNWWWFKPHFASTYCKLELSSVMYQGIKGNMALTQGKPPRNDWKPPRRTKISQSRRGRGAINLPIGDGDYGSTQKAVMTCGDYGTGWIPHWDVVLQWLQSTPGDKKNKLVNQEYDSMTTKDINFHGWFTLVVPSGAQFARLLDLPSFH